MAFQSLYRRYRPQRFGDLVGQDHVATALRNAVREGRVGHAYLLSGPRGTGKTTTARILAKALNCTAPGDDGEPCGECGNCRAVAAGTFSDLVELDAASNNGVEAVRDLIDRVHLGMGASTRRKVYLIDEVHMLTAAASNALLKTLEEPPGHVVFVLATTNPEKVLPTIRSRTQHFEFTLIPTEQLAAHLGSVLASEGVEADSEALDAIARAAAGSARDALSLLDQALAHEPGRLRADAVTAIFGRTPFERRAEILEAVAAEDPAGALAALQELLDSGHEPRRVAADLLQCLRDAFVLHAAGDRVRVDLPDSERERLLRLGSGMGEGPLVRAVEALGRAVVDMRGVDAADPRLVLEVALLRIAHRGSGPPLHVLADRVERLERAVGSGATSTPGAAPEPAPASPRRGAPRARPADGPQPPAPSGDRPRGALGALLRERRGTAAAGDAPDPVPGAGPGPAPGPSPDPPLDSRGGDDPAPGSEGAGVGIDDVIVAWADVLALLGPGARSALQDAQPLRLEGDVVVFGAPAERMGRVKPRFQQEAAAIRAAFSERIGISPRFSVVAHEGFSAPDADPDPSAPPEPSEPPEASKASKAPKASKASKAPKGGRARRGSSARETEGRDPDAAGPPDPDAAGPPDPDAAGPPDPDGTVDLSDPSDEAEEHFDPSELAEAPPAGVPAADPTAHLVEIFDATVVDEIPRETWRD